MITYIDEQPSISVVKLTPDLSQYVNSSWYMNYNSDDVMRCIEVFSNTEQDYNVSFPNSDTDLILKLECTGLKDIKD